VRTVTVGANQCGGIYRTIPHAAELVEIPKYRLGIALS
jgi:hypothetical protein